MPKNTTASRWGILLFGGVFAAIGLTFLFLSIIPTLYEAWQMQGWQPVQARLLDVDLKTSTSDGTTTYAVKASYRYGWRGRQYTGQRVGLSGGSDNIGDWHQRNHERLRRSQYNNETITVWVDPQAPAQSIIDREIRWGLFGFKLVFAVVFGGAGIGIMVFTLRRRPAGTASATPWLDNPAWRNNHIHADGKLLWLLWAFTLVWGLLMIPLLLNADKLREAALPFQAMLYLFPLMLVGMVVHAVIKTLRWRRFGNVVLTLAPFPGEIGGRVAGQVELPLDRREQVTARVRLSCIHVYWRRSGNKSERREEVVWQDSRQARLAPAARGGRLEFSFSTPSDLPPSSDGSDCHKWVLELHASLAGPDLEHRFTIPVFATEGRATEEPLSIQVSPAPKSIAAERVLTPDSLPEWLRLGYRAGGLELYLPMFRNLAVAVPLMLVGAIFGGAGVFMLQQGDAPVPFSLIFTTVGAALVLGGLYSLGNSLRVSVSPRGVGLERRIFGVPLRRTVPPAEVSGLDKRIGVQSGSTAYYKVLLKTASGGQYTVVDSLTSASAADYLIEQLGRQLGLGRG